MQDISIHAAAYLMTNVIIFRYWM